RTLLSIPSSVPDCTSALYFLLIPPPPPRSTLFPYTTLFRSALVDNVRMGHWRMNGEQGKRRLVQIQVESFNAEDHQVDTAQAPRSEEHTSELQSRENLVCRLLLEKKKT